MSNEIGGLKNPDRNSKLPENHLLLNLELLDHAFVQLPTALLANAVLSLLTVTVMLGHIHEPVLISWLIVIWLITGVRYLIYRSYRHYESIENITRWKRLFLTGLYLTAIAWSSSSIFMYTQESLVHQIVLTFVIGGLVSGATTSLAALQKHLRLFIAFMIGPLVVRFLLADNTVSYTLGIMLLLYGCFSAIMSIHVYNIIRNALKLKNRNLKEIKTRKTAEKNLNLYKRNLENLVKERTHELAMANEGLSREIIERKKAEKEKDRFAEQLLHSQKIEAIGTLAGGIAHDFNNILSIIIGFTELTMEELPADSNLREDLQEVYKAAERGKNLVKQILEFSRSELHKPIPIDLRNLVSEHAKLLHATIPSTVRIRTDIDPNCGPVLIDPHQLQRVLTNLATNGVQAMDEVGTLALQLRQVRLDQSELPPKTDLLPGHYARISVTDTGSGISPELKKRIFEPFFTTKEVGKGTGMGLAVVHGIVTTYHGFIKLHSEPEKGTTFHLFFPVTPQKPGNYKPVQTTTQRGHEHILVVDDDQAIVAMTDRYLTKHGYKVTSCSAGREALNKFTAAPQSFDLVITDQTMPDLTGIELAEELHKLQNDLPVILCTGYSTKVTPENIERAAIKTVMIKPIRMQDLAKKVRHLLDEVGPQ